MNAIADPLESGIVLSFLRTYCQLRINQLTGANSTENPTFAELLELLFNPDAQHIVA